MPVLDRFSKQAYEKMEKSFSLGMRAMGPAFIMTLYGLIGYFTFYYFYFMAGVMHSTYPFVFSFGYHLLVGYTFTSLVYNHMMAGLVHPGNIRQLREDISLLKRKGAFGTQNSNNSIKRRFFANTEPSLEMKQLMKFRFEDLSQLDNFHKDFFCKRCNDVKLTRAHHCSICNDCVFLMDHHGPWINSGLGLYNLRYFLLFLFYTMVGCIIAPIAIVTGMHSPPFGDEYRALLRFALTMSGLL